jgi:hypothetical protein
MTADRSMAIVRLFYLKPLHLLVVLLLRCQLGAALTWG